MPTAELEAALDTSMDFEPTFACEGQGHPQGLVGHIPGNDAEYALRAPCCGIRLLICAPRAAWLRTGGRCHCSRCDRDFDLRPDNLVRLP